MHVAGVSLWWCVGRSRTRAKQRTGWSGVKQQVLVSTAQGHKSDGEEEVSGHAPFCCCGWLVSLVSRVPLSRGWFAITRGQQVVIGTNTALANWRNKRGASHTSCVLLFFAGICFVFAPRTRPKPADPPPPRGRAGKHSRNTNAWPVHRPKRDPRVRTNQMDRPTPPGSPHLITGVPLAPVRSDLE